MMTTDVLILGTGVAGLTAAINLSLLKPHLKILLVTRAKRPEDCNSFWAQGGIIHPKKSDDFFSFDIQAASSQTSSESIISLLQERGEEIFRSFLLETINPSFARDEKGDLLYTKEAAHSLPRILYHGDHTGKTLELALLNFITTKNIFSNITILTEHTAIDLITPEHHGISLKQRYEKKRVVGAYLLDGVKNEVIKVLSKKVILATGGLSAIYLNHTNTEGSRGDGMAMAKRAQASLINMEFVQFHPTTLHDASVGGKRFLISEALRGEGAVLVNSKGERFMERYHPLKDLAPRDIVTRSIFEETIATRHHCVYLDVSSFREEHFERRFPTIYEGCQKAGRKEGDLIPVVPAAHYSCGGVKINEWGESDVEGLYAVGEVACSGLHGANRLASTSLLEGIIFGKLTAEKISHEVEGEELYKGELIRDWELGSSQVDLTLVAQDLQGLKQTMWNYVGPIRTKDRLKRAHAMLGELSFEIKKFYKNGILSDELIGLRNAVEVGHLVVEASMRSTDSVGCFYRR